MTLPPLPCPRLSLRPLTEGDRHSLLSLHRDPQVMRFSAALPGDDAALSARMDCNIYRPWPDGHGFWAVERVGLFLGWIMLIPKDGEDGTAEIGYRLHAHAWGQGYATEALIAVTQHAARLPDINRVVAEARADNAASIRVLEKAAFRLLERFTEEEANWVRYGIQNTGTGMAAPGAKTLAWG